MKLCASTNKIRYRDEVAAKLALAIAGRKKHTHRGKEERRVYRCPACRGWHLTSTAANPPTTARSAAPRS